MNIEKAIEYAQSIFSLDKNKIEDLVRACEGQPPHIIDCLVKDALENELFVFPGREIQREGFYNGYLLALVGRKPENTEILFYLHGDFEPDLDKVNKTWVNNINQITSYERSIAELKTEMEELKKNAQRNGLRLSGDQWIVPRIREYLCGGNTVCLTDKCEHGAELLGPVRGTQDSVESMNIDGYSRNFVPFGDPVYYLEFINGSEQSISGKIILKHGCDEKSTDKSDNRNSFSDQLKGVKKWTIKKEQISDASKPRAIITVRSFNSEAGWIKFYWQYESAGMSSRIQEQLISFYGFQEKFEPILEDHEAIKQYKSLVEEAHTVNMKLYYCKRWNAVCKVNKCSKGKELSNIVFSDPGDKNSWYDFKGFAYMQPEPIVLTFTNNKKIKLGNIDGFMEGCEGKE